MLAQTEAHKRLTRHPHQSPRVIPFNHVIPLTWTTSTEEQDGKTRRLFGRAGQSVVLWQRVASRATHSRREIVDPVLYVARTGFAWRQLPAAFPPWQLVSWYFVRWQKQRDTLRMLDMLRHQIRRSQGRGAAPSAGIIDPKASRRPTGPLGRPDAAHHGRHRPHTCGPERVRSTSAPVGGGADACLADRTPAPAPQLPRHQRGP